MAAPDDGDEWQFSLEDLEEGEGGQDGEDGAESGNVAGALRSRGPIEPGNIDPENAFFVLLGALLAGLFVGAIVSLAL